METNFSLYCPACNNNVKISVPDIHAVSTNFLQKIVEALKGKYDPLLIAELENSIKD